MRAKRIQSVALIALAIISTCARANPDSPTVVGGSASFSQPNANTLNVTTRTNKAIINWKGFNIGAGQTTNFIQPNRNSAVLNRVLSKSPSKIYGNLNSNGKVFLINQHGLMIGAGAKISTAGFYGSTLNITNEDFLKGNLKFEGGGFGGIVNKGYIHAGPGGNVVLIAPDIENGGVIEVDNGKVILAAGESIRITSLNDSLIEFDVKSNDDNSIINLGDIVANHGAARLFAGSLTHSGSINATGLVQNVDGSISLVAQANIEVAAGATLNADGDSGGQISVRSHRGDVIFAGKASARGETHHGGRIEILGNRVGLFGTASVDASGKTGGGEVLIGGDFQGKGDTQTAMQTQVGPQAGIHADAIDSGDGGKVIVWAEEQTVFQGDATARGGEESGDGGFIEISGKGNLGYDGSADASAANGAAGNILFDPINVVFAIGGLDTLINPLTFATPGALFTFDPSEITDITNLGNNVTIQADQDITINAAITTTAAGAGGDITFEAGQSILINADITTDNGTLKLYANSFDANFINRGSGVAQIAQGFGTTIDAGTGNVEFWMNSGVNGSAGNIDIADVKANHVLIKHNGVDASGSILQSGGGTITASSLFIDHDGPINGSVGSLDLSLNAQVDNLGAHIHEPTILGIYIDAQPLSAPAVAIGNTCYGNGDSGCITFGSHLIGGLETINGGGSITLGVTGNLQVLEPIQIDDIQGGSAGNISLTASGEIIANSDIRNFITTGNINFNSASGAVSLFNGASVGINGGTISLNSGTGSLLLNSGSFLEGVGTVTGDVFSTGGLIDIGDDSGAVGQLTISGDLFMDTNSILVFDIVGSTTEGTDYDLLNVNGANGVFLAGDLIALWDTQTPPGPATYTLINATTGFAGVFDNVFGPVGTTITSIVNPTTFQLTTTTVSNNIIFWGNAVGGDWAIPGNWVGGVVPGISDFVDINVGNPVTITISNAVPSILGIESQNELVFSGAGQLTINNTSPSIIGDNLSLGSSGGLTVNGDLYLASIVSLDTGTLNGTGDITLSQIGSLTLNGGILDNSVRTFTAEGVVNFNAGSVIGGVGEFFFANNTVNHSSGTWNGGSVIVQAGELYNATGLINLQNNVLFSVNGILDFQTSFAGLNVSSGAATATINGSLIKSSTGTSTIGGSITFSVPGTVDVQAGTLHSGVSYNGGTTLLSGGTLLINSGFGTLTSNTSISGSGTIDGNVTQSGGTLQPGGVGAIGTITITGNYTHGASATLEIELDTLAASGSAGTDYDLLDIGGEAQLFPGTLNLLAIGAFSPSNSDTFVPLTYGTLHVSNNTFATINPTGGETITPAYNATNLSLVVSGLGFFFDNDFGDFSWNSPANWSTDVLPASQDDVSISGFDVTIIAAADANTLSLASNDTLTITSGTLTLASDTTLAGSLVIDGGSVVAGGTLGVGGSVNLLVGSLSSIGTTTVAGLTTWNNSTGFTLSGTGGFNANGGFDLGSNLDNSTLTLNTSLVIGGASSTWLDFGVNQNFITGGGSITNNSTITIVTSRQLTVDVAVTNNGTMTRSGGSSPVVFNGTFNNDGIVNVNASSVEFRGDGTHSGVFNLATDLILDGGGIHNLGGASSVNGAGALVVRSSTLNFSSNYVFAGNLQIDSPLAVVAAPGTLDIGGDLILEGGSLSTVGNLSVTGRTTWRNNTSFVLAGAGVFNANGGFDLGASLDNATLTLNKSLVIGAVSSWADFGATQNFINGTGDITNNANIGVSNDSQLTINVPFVNSLTGLVGKTGGTGNLEFNGSFDNSGAVQLQAALTSFNAGYTQIVGSTLLAGGAMSANVDMNGGLFGGTGTLTGNLNHNAGIVQPGDSGAIGTLMIVGNYTQLSAGNLEIEIASNGGGTPTAGTDNDYLVVNGNANVAGTLTLRDIRGYTVTNNDSFTVMSVTGAPNGAFANIVSIGAAIATPAFGVNDLDITLNFSGLFSWIGPATGNWNTPANWDKGLPGIGDDVSIGAGFALTILAAANANTLSLASTSSLTLSTGTLTIASNSTLDGQLTVSGGTLDISGATVTLNGGLRWDGASTISGGGSGVLNLPAGTNLITGAVGHVLDAAIINNSGSTRYNGGTLQFVNGGGDPVINNSGIFEFVGPVGITDLTDGGTPGFNTLDGGLIVKLGAGTATIDPMPGNSNQGSVIVSTAGALDIGLASWTLGAGDSLSGQGTYIGDVVNNGGMISPAGQGSVGTLTIQGNFANNAGVVFIDTTSLVAFDVLAVTNNATLGGTIEINLGYLPLTSDLQSVITCQTLCSGSFANIVAPPGVTYGQITNTNDLTLDVLSVVFSWIGGNGNNWNTGANWSLGFVPDSTIDVLLPVSVDVVIDTLADANSLTLNGNLSILSGGTLTIKDSAIDLLVNPGANLFVAGGTLSNTGDATFNGGFGHSGGNAVFNGNTAFNANYGQSAGVQTFSGTVSFNGTMTHNGGTAIFNSPVSLPGAVNMSGGVLTFNAGATMSNLNNVWSGGTISGSAPLVLGSVPGDTTLVINGAAVKILDTITLNMNRNDINMEGDGGLLLANNAIIDNSNGQSFIHGGNGSITGVGSLINNGGTYSKISGVSTLAIDLVNDASSVVNVTAATLIIDDAPGSDNATYNVDSSGNLIFAQNRNLTGTLNNAGAVIAGLGTTTTTLTLPANLNNSGALLMNNAVLDLSSQSGNLLELRGTAKVGGFGTVQGNVNNIDGVVAVGGDGTLGSLTITGTYRQGPDSVVLVNVLNNGVEIVSDQLIIDGPAQLNGGTLLIGYLDASLGLVTSDFSPIAFRGGVTGQFSPIIDAGGIQLAAEYSADALTNIVTILGSKPTSPEAIINDLTRFIDSQEELNETFASNTSEAEAVIDELLEETEQGSLVCN